MILLGKRTRTITARTLRGLLLGQVLPTLLLTPSQAGAVLLHSHCEESYHVHPLNGVEFTKWTDGDGAEHHCATEESDTCCETTDSPSAPDGVVLHRPPMLVCRVRSVDDTAIQPTLDVSLPQTTADRVPALAETAEAFRDVGPPHRCLDALLSSSHALLI